MKGKLLLTRAGGGSKTEIRPNQRDAGWQVLNFEYATDGSREKTGEVQSADDGHVVELLKQDPEFFKRFKALCQHPELQA